MKALQIMSIVTTWSITALEDGKVTLREATSLVEQIAGVLGVPVDFEFSKGE